MIKSIRNVAILTLVVASLACADRSVVSYETVNTFQPARGSISMGYSGAALNAATRISEVRQKCGTPLAEWEERIPFFNPTIKKLKYKTYDPNHNVLTTVFVFAMTTSDPSLIAIDSQPTT